MYGYPYVNPCCPPPYPIACGRPGFGAGWLFALVVILFILLLLGGGYWCRQKFLR
ncbi:sporulation protein YjcZ [Sutcliffiella cohnii]|uniref:sporulation protein YjcZ n=1 Tax=Sutcliffiella TaxID=2837511 RepID=UPI000AD63728|nr:MULTISPECIES: sporulation protein YjcZ [Sutcliffiella]MED4016448.1 sporulation protein YjcZ [Sutcliffiella cohnii]WBL13900.1 sporulation protein YjcZ [Sutcliffiella sp. NC1]